MGRGNHFVELARVGPVLDDVRARKLGLSAGDPVLVVHSGSRGIGERILRSHTEARGAGPAADAAEYLAAHDAAVRWAGYNRRLIAARVGDALGAEIGEPVVDLCHNFVEVRDGIFLHRKGAAPGDGRDVLVAGTRGTRSYLVAAHAGQEANFSVAHGAGRKMSRADALRRGQAKHTVEELRRTPVGSIVVCGDRQLLFEEAPAAYKRVEQVIGDLVDHGLATPICTTVPLVTYKTPERRSGDARTAGRRGRRPGAAMTGDAEILLLLSAETLADAWSGTLCWQARSPYRPDHARKNWFVVARRQQAVPDRRMFREGDVDVVAVRTGGPGGQHRNKAATAVRATHRPSGTVVVVDDERRFSANRRIALQILRERLERGDAEVARVAGADRRSTHDRLVRGDPVRVERPAPAAERVTAAERAGAAKRRR